MSVLFLLAGAEAAHAQAEGHRILFPDSTTVSEDDQRTIFQQLGYTVSADGTALEASDCGTIYSRSILLFIKEAGAAITRISGSRPEAGASSRPRTPGSLTWRSAGPASVRRSINGTARPTSTTATGRHRLAAATMSGKSA